MTPKQVYLEAGRSLAEGEVKWSCHAVKKVGIEENYSRRFTLLQKYQNTFFPEGDDLLFANAVDEFAVGSALRARNLGIIRRLTGLLNLMGRLTSKPRRDQIGYSSQYPRD